LGRPNREGERPHKKKKKILRGRVRRERKPGSFVRKRVLDRDNARREQTQPRKKKGLWGMRGQTPGLPSSDKERSAKGTTRKVIVQTRRKLSTKVGERGGKELKGSKIRNAPGKMTTPPQGSPQDKKNGTPEPCPQGKKNGKKGRVGQTMRERRIKKTS